MNHCTFADVKPETIDTVLNQFWGDCKKLGVESIAVVDALRFQAVFDQSKEWPVFSHGLIDECIRMMRSGMPVQVALQTYLSMLVQTGIQIGFEAAKSYKGD